MKQPTYEQITKLVNLVMSVFDDSPLATEKHILDYVLKNRRKKLRFDSGLTPTQIRQQLPMILAKLTSGGRTGVAYFRKERG